MANDTTTTMSNSLKTAYLANYMEAAFNERLYDQYASPVGADQADLMKSSSITIPFVSKMRPSETPISEIADITPKNLRDATVTLTPTSRGDAIQVSEALMIKTYTDYGKRRFEIIGENQMESVDLIAKTASLTGDLVVRSAATRAALDGGTAADRLLRATFVNVATRLSNMRVPYYVTPRGKRWISTMNPFAFADLISVAPILEVGEYQDKGIILNMELGELAGFTLVVSPKAKLFLGAGAANGTAFATTIAASTGTNYSNIALAKTIEVAAIGAAAVGMKIMIGTIETANIHYETNEWVTITAIAGTTITIIGAGENGGLMYDHAVAETVSNADFVAPVVYGGPESLGKVYAKETGEFGQVVGPKKQGLLDQFESLGWKWYGGYGVISGNRIVRSEHSISFSA